jgi:Phage integrase family
VRAGEDMAHQFVREPLRAEEADRLANACQTVEEKLIVWTLLDTGLRVSELCSLALGICLSIRPCSRIAPGFRWVSAFSA